MADFYGNVLGLAPIEETRIDSWVEFDAGGARLALHAIPDPLASRIEISSPPRAREENPVKLAFLVDDVEREQARMAALGIELVRKPWGACEGVDPEGNIFQICSDSTSDKP